MSIWRVPSAAMLGAALLAPPAEAARLVPLTRIDNPQAISDPNAAVDARFGAAVAVAGNILLVGVPRHDAGGFEDRGQVRVFQRVGGVWNPVASVEGPSAGANFGASLAVSGDIVIIGAPGANQARVYRLTGTTLTEVTSLTGGTGVNAIGLAVAAAPGVVFAGGADALVYRTGSGTSWSAQFSIGPSDPARVAFGASLAVSGGQLLVGDPGQSGGFGAVYIGADAGGGNWGVTNKLTQPGAIGFGGAVALRAPTIAILGAPGTPFGPSFAVGNVRVWSTTGGGTELQSLAPVPPISGENFGSALATSGATVLVGAPAETASGSEAGAVYAYRCQAAGFNPCAFGQRVQAAGGAPGDRFGAALATDGNLAVVGAPRFDPAGSNDAGSVFVYAVDAEGVFADGFEVPLQ